MSIEIDARFLPILDRFAGKRDVRFYLNGFYTEPHGDGGAILVATNGYVLVACRDGSAKVRKGEIWPVPSFAKVGLWNKPGGERARFDANGACLLRCDDVVERDAAEPIDGKFPDWRKVLVAEPEAEGDRIGVDADYLGIFKGLRRHGYRLGINLHVPSREDQPLTMRLDGQDEVVALIMPRQTMSLPGRLPDWMEAPTPRKRAPRRKKAA